MSSGQIGGLICFAMQDSNQRYRVLLYYKYVEITDPVTFVQEHQALCQSLELKGRILVAPEGISGTVAGTQSAIVKYKAAFTADPRFADMEFKENDCDRMPFPRLRVRARKEVVTLGVTDIRPEERAKHLNPKEWHALAEKAGQRDIVILDARNNFESAVGRFKHAITPNIDSFREFPQWVKQHAEQLRNKKVLMYCTGGIRCEKASALLKREGVNEVYQLHGGIINYGKQIPDGLWEGVCYVFDDRVGVRVNDNAHHTVIGTCHFCDTSTDDYYNCCNAECNKRILLCNECSERSNAACSKLCSTKHRLGIVKHWNIQTRTAE